MLTSGRIVAQCLRIRVERMLRESAVEIKAAAVWLTVAPVPAFRFAKRTVGDVLHQAVAVDKQLRGPPVDTV